MNKKDIAEIKKQFKHDNISLSIHKISSSLVSAKEKRILFSETKRFDMLSEENAELYYQNIKKMLTGSLGKKMHELSFSEGNHDDKGQTLLYGIHTGKLAPKEIMDAIAERLDYPFNYVISVLFGKYSKASKSLDEDYNYNFIVCTVNYVEQPKRAMSVNYSDKVIVPSSVIDANIDLSSPVDGFIFPAFNDNCEDVSKVLYSSRRANKPNLGFVEEILGSEIIMTADEEKSKFVDLLRHGLGETMVLETLANIYEQLNVKIESSKDSKVPTVGLKEIRKILENSSIEDFKIKKIEERFEDLFGNDNYKIKSTSLAPSTSSKSVKVSNNVLNFSINPRDLDCLKPIIKDGKKCLLIEMDTDIEVDGYTIKHKS